MLGKLAILRRFAIVAGFGLLVGCGSAGDKVLQDFGIKERPEDYVSGADRVMAKLPDVGKVEIDRLNAAQRRGEILVGDQDSLSAAYFKRVKVYEGFHPLDAHPATKTSQNAPVEFVGYIEYSYQYYESARKQTRTEAASAIADIPTGKRGRDSFRYRFNSGATWNGGRGEPYTN